MTAARVDVVIAARNEAARLGDCLASLAAQDHPRDRVRIVVVDNGSSDATAEVAAAHGAEVLREDRPGPGAARNRAIAETDGELVAFLDAHCVVNPVWISAMAARFAEPRVGGCQARIDNRAENPRLQRYLTRTGAQANPRTLEDTLGGERNIYPWILSGNSMYRREALTDTGGFDVSLVACEDVDLAWRAVLLGYHLAYCDEAVAIHHSGHSWLAHVGKARRYGSASAVLARRYLPRGDTTTFAPAALWSTDLDHSLVALSYWLGYRGRRARDAGPPLPQAALARFRAPFAWREDSVLRISEQAVFWPVGEATTMVVHVPSRVRVALDDSGHLVWQRLAAGASRAETVRTLTDHYGIAPATAEADLDDLVEELLAAQLLIAA